MILLAIRNHGFRKRWADAGRKWTTNKDKYKKNRISRFPWQAWRAADTRRHRGGSESSGHVRNDFSYDIHLINKKKFSHEYVHGTLLFIFEYLYCKCFQKAFTPECPPPRPRRHAAARDSDTGGRWEGGTTVCKAFYSNRLECFVGYSELFKFFFSFFVSLRTGSPVSCPSSTTTRPRRSVRGPWARTTSGRSGRWQRRF